MLFTEQPWYSQKLTQTNKYIKTVCSLEWVYSGKYKTTSKWETERMKDGINNEEQNVNIYWVIGRI